MELALFLSLFVYLLYMFSLNFINLKVRRAAVIKGRVSPKYFKVFQGEELPEEVALHTRHNDNQYQAPILFFIIGSLTLSIGEVSLYSVLFAWCFVFSRFLHSYFLLKGKNILNRAKAYILGWVFIILMWVVLGSSYL